MKKLNVGQKVFFTGETLPFEVMAASERYVVATRRMDKIEDLGLLEFEVERGAYCSVEEAYQDNKDYAVYSLLDFVALKRAPDNLIFGMYDYLERSDCEKALSDLIDGHLELSMRHGINLNIDWDKTNATNE